MSNPYIIPDDYKSPITIIEEFTNSIIQEHDNQIMCKIRTVVDVDKDELIKMANYDRNQYECGYQAAVRKFVRHGHWIFNDNNATMTHWYSCSECDYDLPLMHEKTNFCPNCGARMDESEAEE